nr:PREDICTED: tigger transposable element-derived protein 6-like [Latimeria chalumnae]|eukprot:XP_006010436.1 PREDICTED: tigger transposable element-derived protein 6-like [Latimeria chalumnae]
MQVWQLIIPIKENTLTPIGWSPTGSSRRIPNTVQLFLLRTSCDQFCLLILSHATQQPRSCSDISAAQCLVQLVFCNSGIAIVCIVISQQKKRHDLLLHEQVDVLNSVKELKVQKLVTQKHKIFKSQVSRILKRKAAILKDWEENENRDRKWKRQSNVADIGEALFMWFKHRRAQKVLIDGNLLKAKANKLAKELGLESFEASSGFLFHWKVRHNLVYKNLCGEKADSDKTFADSWTEEVLPGLVAEYPPNCIYNCDKTGLYYHSLPDGTYVSKREKVSGGKKTKEHLTSLLCPKQTGSHKVKPLMIGKSKNPRCFKNVRTFPTDYKNSANAWMTQRIFEKWLHSFNNTMKERNKKVLLLMDNATCHDVTLHLSHVKIEFLPPNTTSIIQPLDQGIIHSTKRHYKKHFLHRLVSVSDSNDENMVSKFVKSFSVLDAMHLVNVAWKSVTSTCITNCFIKCGYVSTNENSDPSEVEEADEGIPYGLSKGEFDIFVSADDELEICGEMSDTEIVSSLKTSVTKDTDVKEDERELEVPKVGEVDSALCTLRRFMESKDTGTDIFDDFYVLEGKLWRLMTSALHQKKITDFFTS